MAKLYGSVSGQSKEIKKLYGSVGGVSKEIKKLYASVNGQSKLIYEAASTATYGTVYYKASSSATTVQEVAITSLAEFNGLVGTSSASLANVVVNGVTLNATGTNIIVGLEIGSQITSIPDYFLRGCMYFNRPLVLPSGLTSIGANFLYGCSSFNQALTLPSSLTSIGSHFLYICSSFNQALTLPSSLTSIGGSFLYGCKSFNRALTLPSSLTSIGSIFLYNCDAMTSYVNVGSLAATIVGASSYVLATTNSEAASYTTGIKIRGSNRAAWMTRFPNRTSSPYRKLVDYGG